jgi:hypothetical protein
MALPKIKHPTFEFKIPSTGKKEIFRPFLVKEEKLLLIAKSSEDKSDILRAIKQVINNCCINDNFDIDKISIFDLEYLFLQIRAVSVNNVVKVSYRDNEDEQVYEFEIDLSKVEVQFPENINKNIKITDQMGILMKYPSASIFDDKDYFKDSNNAVYELIVRSIDKIYDADDIHDPANYSSEEIEAFLDDCGVAVFEKIQEFMTNNPKLYHKIEYQNANGNTRVIELSSLTDFFTLG